MLKDEIIKATEETLRALTVKCDYECFDDFRQNDKDYCYELVIEKLYKNPDFCEAMLLDNLLFMIMREMSCPSAKDEVYERLSDICDHIFNAIVESYHAWHIREREEHKIEIDYIQNSR